MNPIRILIVDDDDVDREVLQRLLRSVPQQIEVTEADSQEQAQLMLNERDFDCVLLDYHLSDAVGLDLLPRIREHSGRVCPVIVISTRGNEDLVVKAMREGVYDYVSKSQLCASELSRKLECALRWAEQEQALKLAHQRMQQLSFYDDLTGLANRALMFDRMDQMIVSADRSGEMFSLFMMDLNLFKEVNDTLGHEAGDEVLQEVAQRIRAVVRKSDTVARLGGDEFVVLLPVIQDADNAVRVAEKIGEAIRRPMRIHGETVCIGISIGISQYPMHAADGRSLLKAGDQAMYHAKRGARGVQMYSEKLRLSETQTVLLSNSLQEAAANGELVVYYQPQIELASRRVIGKEALVRWQHPERGLLGPGEFIPAAERSTAIVAITDATLEMSLDQERRWRERGFAVPVSVNLSPRMLDDDKLPCRIAHMLHDRRLPPQCLILELTETALVSSPVQAQKTLGRLSEMGVKISIDDFGSGFTSFRQLRELDIAEIKIDGLYVTDVQADGRDASIVHSIAELGRGFDIRILAERVEHQNTWELLRSLGCHSAQGFSIAKAMAANDFDHWAQGWNQTYRGVGTALLAG